MRLRRPWLWLPASWSHQLAPYGLKISSLFHDEDIPEWQALEWKGLHFKNRLGLAGGVDKNAESLKDWWQHGAGFVEVGTVTPQPQEQNPGKVIHRDTKNQSVWNRLGFPSHGASEVLANIKLAGTKRTPLFVNIGKNRNTSIENASGDYIYLMKYFYEVADVFVVNISSPNTKDLRLLQKKENLQNFLKPLVEFRKTNPSRPLLIKLSPDEDEKAFHEMLETCVEARVDGFVLTNTTSSRDFENNYPTEGGVSGRPLSERSKLCLTWTTQFLGPRKKDFLIVSAGGVDSHEGLMERLNLGADLIEVYSALIFQGPSFFKRMAKNSQKRTSL